MVDFFKYDQKSALEGMELAQWIAFAPVVFQASRALKSLGILSAIDSSRKKGISVDELISKTDLSLYGLRVLCEAGLGIGLLYFCDDKFFISKAGHFFLHDQLTEANTDFINDVCYKGLFSLEESVKNGKPEGLKEFGNWKTVYEALSQLPPGVQESWFKFDHYYSDSSFQFALPVVFAESPRRLLDIGGNTGKWAFAGIGYNENVHISIMDLPGQLQLAQQFAHEKGITERIDFLETNLLTEETEIPKGYDVIWMSQFLDCFSDSEIVSILSRCAKAIDNNGRIFIMETFWDRQQFKTAAFCLQMTSLYFTTIANGNSQMYNSGVFFALIKKAGLEIEKVFDNIGVSHTIVKCKLPV